MNNETKYALFTCGPPFVTAIVIGSFYGSGQMRSTHLLSLLLTGAAILLGLYLWGFTGERYRKRRRQAAKATSKDRH